MREFFERNFRQIMFVIFAALVTIFAVLLNYMANSGYGNALKSVGEHPDRTATVATIPFQTVNRGNFKSPRQTTRRKVRTRRDTNNVKIFGGDSNAEKIFCDNLCGRNLADRLRRKSCGEFRERHGKNFSHGGENFGRDKNFRQRTNFHGDA